MKRTRVRAWMWGATAAVAASVVVKAPDACAQSAPSAASTAPDAASAPQQGTTAQGTTAPGTTSAPGATPATTPPTTAPAGGATDGTTTDANTAAPAGPSGARAIQLPPPLPPPAPASLRFQAVSPQNSWQIELVTPEGVRRCDVAGRRTCTIANVTPGTVRFRLRGTSTFQREMEIFEGPSLVRIAHVPPANGIAAGLITMGIGLALGGVALGIGLACAPASAMCVNSAVPDPYSAWVIPLGITAAAGLVLGTVMLAWHQPAQDTLEISLDESAPAGATSRATPRARPRRASPPVRIAGGAAPVAGGAMFGLGVSL